jgi:hypothetical protein
VVSHGVMGSHSMVGCGVVHLSVVVRVFNFVVNRVLLDTVLDSVVHRSFVVRLRGNSFVSCGGFVSECSCLVVDCSSCVLVKGLQMIMVRSLSFGSGGMHL